MGVILESNVSYLEYTAILDIVNSQVVNIFELVNTIGVVSITDTPTSGQFKVNLSTQWPDQKTWIPNQPVPNNSDPITDVYFICWNRNFSLVDSLLFDILDKNGNYANNLSVTGIAFTIRFYNNVTII